MRTNEQCKPAFVKHMLAREEKRGKPFSDEEKILAWDVWKQCWNVVRLQLRREAKAILKQDKQLLRRKIKEDLEARHGL